MFVGQQKLSYRKTFLFPLGGNRAVQKISQNQVIVLTSVVAVAIGFILSIPFFGLLHNRALLTKQQNDPSLQGIYKEFKNRTSTEGLSYPTSMSFADDNKILILEKYWFSSSYFSWSFAGQTSLEVILMMLKENVVYLVLQYCIRITTRLILLILMYFSTLQELIIRVVVILETMKS